VIYALFGSGLVELLVKLVEKRRPFSLLKKRIPMKNETSRPSVRLRDLLRKTRELQP